MNGNERFMKLEIALWPVHDKWTALPHFPASRGKQQEREIDILKINIKSKICYLIWLLSRTVKSKNHQLRLKNFCFTVKIKTSLWMRLLLGHKLLNTHVSGIDLLSCEWKNFWKLFLFIILITDCFECFYVWIHDMIFMDEYPLDSGAAAASALNPSPPSSRVYFPDG